MGRSWSRDEERAAVGASGSARETLRALVANGNLYCPTTPRTLLELSPLARDATPNQEAAHDQQTTELARHKLGKITSDPDPVGEEGLEVPEHTHHAGKRHDLAFLRGLAFLPGWPKVS